MKHNLKKIHIDTIDWEDIAQNTTTWRNKNVVGATAKNGETPLQELISFRQHQKSIQTSFTSSVMSKPNTKDTSGGHLTQSQVIAAAVDCGLQRFQ